MKADIVGLRWDVDDIKSSNIFMLFGGVNILLNPS